jgi:hypothetical protein
MLLRFGSTGKTTKADPFLSLPSLLSLFFRANHYRVDYGVPGGTARIVVFSPLIPTIFFALSCWCGGCAAWNGEGEREVRTASAAGVALFHRCCADTA